jgi:hypothetical protein
MIPIPRSTSAVAFIVEASTGINIVIKFLVPPLHQVVCLWRL